MSQSTYIVATLLAGFVLFLAARDRLSAYTAVLWGATTQAAPSGPSSSGSGSGSGIAGIGAGQFGNSFGGGSGGSSGLASDVQLAGTVAAFA